MKRRETSTELRKECLPAWTAPSKYWGMEKNFSICPHCAAKGKQRLVRPATPHRNSTRAAPGEDGFEIVALFRYDLDLAEVKGRIYAGASPNAY
jgi:hypothetical protein